MPEKQHREYRTKPDPQHELLGQGRPCPGLQRKGSQEGKDHRDTIVDIHRAKKIALFALKAEATDRTSLVHRTPGAEERPHATARTAQARPTPEQRQGPWDTTLLLHRCIPPRLARERTVLVYLRMTPPHIERPRPQTLFLY